MKTHQAITEVTPHTGKCAVCDKDDAKLTHFDSEMKGHICSECIDGVRLADIELNMRRWLKRPQGNVRGQ